MVSTRDNQDINQLVTTEEKERLEKIDSDGDGLSDWEESLWGTDPENPDTDNDGTKDGVEVDQNRDPNDNSRNDSFSVSATTSETENATAKVASKILPQAFVLAVAQQNGEDISQNDIERLATSLESDAGFNFKTYSQSDLNILDNPTTEQIRSYLQGLINSLATSQNQRNPLSVITAELKDQETEKIDLSAYITTTQQVVERLKKMPVPRSYANNHLAVINDIAKVSAAIEAMQQIEIDPINGIIGAQTYKKSLQAAEESAAKLSQQINQDLN